MNSKQFKKQRQDLNLSIKQMANELGLDSVNGGRTIRRIENGEYKAGGTLLRCLELYIKVKELREEIVKLKGKSNE